MKRYTPPTFYSVDVEPGIISTSPGFFGTSLDDDTPNPTEEETIGGETDGFDAPTYRSTLWGNN